jgi:hypothetical protein
MRNKMLVEVPLGRNSTAFSLGALQAARGVPKVFGRPSRVDYGSHRARIFLPQFYRCLTLATSTSLTQPSRQKQWGKKELAIQRNWQEGERVKIDLGNEIIVELLVEGDRVRGL